LAASDEVLPVLAALPLFVWLASPWRWRDDGMAPEQRPLAVGCGFFVVGILFSVTLFLAIGWVAILWAWLSVRVENPQKVRVKQLMVLPLLAFPWITLDMQQVGWWFRLSGAVATEQVFRMAGYEAVREGTNLLIAGRPISVEAACSGMQTLQAMLIAGVIAAYIVLGNSRRYWMNLLVILPLAWLANTLRIIVLSLATIWVSPEFAQGAFHDWGGLAVVFLTFALCCGLFQWQKNRDRRGNSLPGSGSSLTPIPIKL
jgi:exosortase